MIIIIKLENISKKIGHKKLFNNFNYSFENGKVYAIVGQSGSGKSTLLNIISGLESPTNGYVRINNKVLTKKKLTLFFRDSLGYLFQNYGLIDNQSVKKNLLVALAYKKINNNDKEAKMRAVLKKVGINCSLDTKIFSLSGGEQQRIAMARLILKEPSIILADEPTGSLDKKNGDNIVKNLITLANESGIVIIATHDMQLARLCDEIINLDDIN